MKKVMALVALVAMIAVSSVAYAQTTSVTTTANVGSSLSISGCGALAAADFSTDLSIEEDLTCLLTMSANDVWDLYLNDANDNGGNTENDSGSIPCTGGACSTTADQIEGVADGDVSAGVDGGEVGYYLELGTSTATLDACNLATAVCNVNQDDAGVANTRAIDEETALQTGTTLTFHYNVAVDNAAPVQPAGTYQDTWTATVEVD